MNVFLDQYSSTDKEKRKILLRKFSVCIYDYTSNWESDLNQYSKELKSKLIKITEEYKSLTNIYTTSQIIEEGMKEQHALFFKKIDILWQAFYNPKNLNKQKTKE